MCGRTVQDASERGSRGSRGAYAFLLHMLIGHLGEDLLFDPDFPTFRVIDPRTRSGGDNADQRYLMSRVTGGETYRPAGRCRSRAGPC